MVTEDPYRLANDFYGIGFFSADKVALSIGLALDSKQRMIAAIKHVLPASREQGHCYLTAPQINSGVVELIEINLGDRLKDYLELMKDLAVFVGTRKVLSMTIRQQDVSQRQTALEESLK